MGALGFCMCLKVKNTLFPDLHKETSIRRKDTFLMKGSLKMARKNLNQEIPRIFTSLRVVKSHQDHLHLHLHLTRRLYCGISV